MRRAIKRGKGLHVPYYLVIAACFFLAPQAVWVLFWILPQPVTVYNRGDKVHAEGYPAVTEWGQNSSFPHPVTVTTIDNGNAISISFVA